MDGLGVRACGPQVRSRRHRHPRGQSRLPCAKACSSAAAPRRVKACSSVAAPRRVRARARAIDRPFAAKPPAEPVRMAFAAKPPAGPAARAAERPAKGSAAAARWEPAARPAEKWVGRPEAEEELREEELPEVVDVREAKEAAAAAATDKVQDWKRLQPRASPGLLI